MGEAGRREEGKEGKEGKRRRREGERRRKERKEGRGRYEQGVIGEGFNERSTYSIHHLTPLPPPHTSHLLTPHTSLTKDVEKRPHYSELLTHPLILEYETKPVDIGLWYQEVCKTHP